jgi:hypothetical protein
MGVQTLLSVDSVGASEARCALLGPGFFGVQQQIALHPARINATQPGVVYAPGSTDRGMFSSTGLRPGGNGFFFVLFMSLGVALLAAAALVFLGRRWRAARKTAGLSLSPATQFSQASQQDHHLSNRSGLAANKLPGKIALPPADPEVVDASLLSLPSSSPPLPMGSPTTANGVGDGYGYDAVLQPQFQDMEYPAHSSPPTENLRASTASTGQATPATNGRVPAEPSSISSSIFAHGGGHAAQKGRIFQYGSSSNASSARSSRATSKAVSRAGSMPGSRAHSRRVSPERLLRNQQAHHMVSVPASHVVIPRDVTATHRSSFIIGELSNKADDILAQRIQRQQQQQDTLASAAASATASSTVAPSAAAADASHARHASTAAFANLEGDDECNTFFSQESFPLSPGGEDGDAIDDDLRGFAGGGSQQRGNAALSNYHAAAPAGIQFAPSVKHQITHVRRGTIDSVQPQAEVEASATQQHPSAIPNALP